MKIGWRCHRAPHPICYVEIKKKETIVLAPTRLLTLLVIGVSGVGFAGTAEATEELPKDTKIAGLPVSLSIRSEGDDDMYVSSRNLLLLLICSARCTVLSRLKTARCRGKQQ